MVESQNWQTFGSSTPGPFFGHNLCFRCPNEQCEPILDIYDSRAFHWYKERHNPLSFDPSNRSLKFWESTGLHLPKWELPWECEGSLPHTLLHSRESLMWLSGFPWPAPLQPLCLGRKPKARVATLNHKQFKSTCHVYYHVEDDGINEIVILKFLIMLTMGISWSKIHQNYFL